MLNVKHGGGVALLPLFHLAGTIGLVFVDEHKSHVGVVLKSELMKNSVLGVVMMFGLWGCASKENTKLYMVRYVGQAPVMYDSAVVVGQTQTVTVKCPPERRFYSIWLAKPPDHTVSIRRVEVHGPPIISEPVIDVGGISASFKALKVGEVTLVFFTGQGKHTTKIRVIESKDSMNASSK